MKGAAGIAEMTAGLNGPDLIAQAERSTFWTRGDICRASGITAGRLAEIGRGAKPTKAERAAINWAIALRNL